MTRSERRFFLLACGLRLVLVLFVRAGHPAGAPGAAATFAIWGGDTFSYLDPIESLLEHGIYAQDLTRLDTYAGRMPGYGLVYGALRLLLAPAAAADGLVLLEVAAHHAEAAHHRALPKQREAARQAGNDLG